MRAHVVLVLGLIALSGCKHHKGAKEPQTKKSKGGHHSSTWEAPSEGAKTDDLAGKCTLPVHNEDGFTIGYPAGWSMDFGSGTIMVSKDEKNLEGALVFPGRLRQDVSATRFADSFGDALGRTIERGGGTFALDDRVGDDHIARAKATATVEGVPLRGNLQVVAEKGFVTAKLYWAPEAKFADEEDTLRGVVTCFHREMLVTAKAPKPKAAASAKSAIAATTPTKPMKPFQTKFFTGQMPEGWVVKDETANGIDLVSADKMEAVGFGWIQNPITAPGDMVKKNITSFHPDARVLTAGYVPNQKPGWAVFSAEYESPQAHGIDQAATTQGVQLMSSILAAPAQWDKSKGTLSAIVKSIQMTPAAVSAVNAQIRAQIAALPRVAPSSSSSATSSSSSSSSSSMSAWEERWASEDKRNQQFSDALLGQDRATSPSTGEQYVVPQSAWNPTGPQGAGYYRATPGGGAELLNVDQ